MARVNALYQQAGAIAFDRSAFFDHDTTISALHQWASDFEATDIELVRLEIDMLPKPDPQDRRRATGSPLEGGSVAGIGRGRANA